MMENMAMIIKIIITIFLTGLEIITIIPFSKMFSVKNRENPYCDTVETIGGIITITFIILLAIIIVWIV